MPTLQNLREELGEAWDSLVIGWQKLYRRAAGAMTRFTKGAAGGGALSPAEARELDVRSVGWGVMAAEVFDGEDQVVVRLEAPGLDKEDFDLQVQGDLLLIRGHKQLESERTQGAYRIAECAYGAFERTVPLPEQVQADQAKASYKKGVLRVELPKAASGRRRRLKVDVG